MPTVDQYMATLPPEVKPVLERVRSAIREAAPKAAEVIAYHIPGYTYLGPLIYFAAYKKHCSLFGISKNIREKYAHELESFKISGSTIQFTHERPLPVTLLKKIIRARVKENEEKKSGAPKKSRQPHKK